MSKRPVVLRKNLDVHPLLYSDVQSPKSSYSNNFFFMMAISSCFNVWTYWYALILIRTYDTFIPDILDIPLRKLLFYPQRYGVGILVWSESMFVFIVSHYSVKAFPKSCNLNQPFISLQTPTSRSSLGLYLGRPQWWPILRQPQCPAVTVHAASVTHPISF